jgi:hypothetical protein
VLPTPLYSAAEVEAVLARLQVREPVSLSGLLHAVRIYGLDGPVPLGGQPAETLPALTLILDHEKGSAYFRGEPPLINTRDGVRTRVTERRDAKRQPGRQAHSGQLLAVLAELGVPLDTSLTTANGRFAVRDILRDTTANFSLDQEEIEWAAVGLALYLAPEPGWRDKFGRPLTFDQLAKRLLEIPLTREGLACQGTHLLHALTVLHVVDRERPVLGPEVQAEIRERLRRETALLVETQRPTGEWWAGWSDPQASRELLAFVSNDQHTRMAVTVTGHHLEWLLLLPPDLRPPDEVFRRAGAWLRARLLRATKEELKDGYCPYSHAARVVQALSVEQAGETRGQ